VDEFIHVTELELDRGADVVEADDAGVLADDFQAAFQLALVIVRHFQDEQVLKDVAVDH
jgi:hypothetical protein